MSLYKIKCRMSKGNMINIGVLKHSSPVSFDKILTLKTFSSACAIIFVCQTEIEFSFPARSIQMYQRNEAQRVPS